MIEVALRRATTTSRAACRWSEPETRKPAALVVVFGGQYTKRSGGRKVFQPQGRSLGTKSRQSGTATLPEPVPTGGVRPKLARTFQPKHVHHADLSLVPCIRNTRRPLPQQPAMACEHIRLDPYRRYERNALAQWGGGAGCSGSLLQRGWLLATLNGTEARLANAEQPLWHSRCVFLGARPAPLLMIPTKGREVFAPGLERQTLWSQSPC